MLEMLQCQLIREGMSYDNARRFAHSICLMLPMNIDDKNKAQLLAQVGSALLTCSRILNHPRISLNPEEHKPLQIYIDGEWHTA